MLILNYISYIWRIVYACVWNKFRKQKSDGLRDYTRMMFTLKRKFISP